MTGPETRPRHSRNDRHRCAWLDILIVAWGFQAIVTQTLLLREAVVLMFGSEFAWSVVLSAWLLGVAGGGFIGGWVAERIRRADIGLVTVLLLLSVAAGMELWLFRGARAWLGVEPGELLPLAKTALAAMLFVSPVSALVGAAFPLACCVTHLAEPANASRYTKEGPQASAHTDSPRAKDGQGATEALADTDGWDGREGGAGTSSPFSKGGKRGVRLGILELGSVYALESAGSLIGGAVFSFWAVEHLAPIETVLICGAVTLAASAGMLFTTSRKPYGAAGLAMLAGWVLLIAGLAGDDLEQRLVERRWRQIAPGYELVDHTESKYQNLAVGRLHEQFTLYSDGRVTSDFPDLYTFVPLAHFWMCQHPAPRSVLMLGGGAEGLLAEILRHPVGHVVYVEPDPKLIELVTPYLADIHRAALRDPRVDVHHVDARFFVKTHANRFDLVIARLPEPMSALTARLYTDEFYEELRRAMTADAVLCLTAAGTPGSLTEDSAEYLGSLRATLARHFPQIVVGWGDPAHVLAATGPGLVSTDPAELTRRYVSRGVQADLFDPAWFDGATDWLAWPKLDQRAEELDRAPRVSVSTDLHPLIYLKRLMLWEQMTGGRGSRTIARLRSIGWAELILFLPALGLLILSGTYLRTKLHTQEPARNSQSASSLSPLHSKRGTGSAVQTTGSHHDWLARGAITLSIASTGFVTMALSIIWLFAFQSLYGYVYQRIGWIIAVFMGGLVIGCSAATWRLNRLSSSPLTKGGKGGVEGHATSDGREWEECDECPTEVGEPDAIHHAWRSLIAIDFLLALLCLSIPFILPALGAMQTTPAALRVVEWCVTSMVAFTGILGGAAFALAGRIQLESTGRPGAAAGGIVGADHAGACLGALLSGLLLVPVFGTLAAAFLLGGVKIVSAALLVVTPRHGTG